MRNQIFLLLQILYQYIDYKYRIVLSHTLQQDDEGRKNERNETMANLLRFLSTIHYFPNTRD